MLQEICWASSKYVRAFRTWWWRWRFYDNVIVEDPHILILALFSGCWPSCATLSELGCVGYVTRIQSFGVCDKNCHKKHPKKFIILSYGSLNGQTLFGLFFDIYITFYEYCFIILHYIWSLHFVQCDLFNFDFWFLVHCDHLDADSDSPE